MVLQLLPEEPRFQPLPTARLLLRPLHAGDAAEVHRLVNDWAVVRMLSRLPFPYPRRLTDDWIASTGRQMEAGTGYHLAITGEEDGREVVVGCVGLRLDGKRGVGSLGFWVGRRFWGHGVATEAAEAVSRWALAALPVERLVADVAEDNLGSLAVLRRIGFREVGRGRERFLARGGEHPVIRFEASRADLALVGPASVAAVGPTSIAAVGPTSVAAVGPASVAAVGPASVAAVGPTSVAAVGPTSVSAAVMQAAPDAPREKPARPGSVPLVLVAACALIDPDGRVLLAQRPAGKSMAGLWEFPGGKLNPGETPEAALIRELAEELGINVSASCLAPFAFASHAYERFHLLMPLYLCRRWQGRPEGREGQALAWVRTDRLKEYPMPPADVPLIAQLRDFL